MAFLSTERTPGIKLAFAILIAGLLAIPLFTVYLLVYDRESQSQTAVSSIAQGWGGPQTIAGPLLVIPYQTDATESVTEGGRQVTRVNRVWGELELAPEIVELSSSLRPERRKRSIYEVVVYSARTEGRARFRMPADLARYGVAPGALALDRAELRFGLSDAKGLYGAPPSVRVDGRTLALQPGKGPGETNGSGFHAPLDAAGITGRPLLAAFAFDFRGHGWLTLSPRAGDTRWQVTGYWPHPSFQGGFLPTRSQVGDGFTANYRIGNLALGRALVEIGGGQSTAAAPVARDNLTAPAGINDARIQLITPVDLYAQVNRSVKYGFLFIGFTFIAFLLFDVVAGVRVSAVEYLLVGAGLVLFFVMLLAFAEVIGFTPAYVLASAMIIGQLTAYSAAILRSRRRASVVAGLLVALYGVLYALLSLEAYSLLIGSLLLFAALAAVMYLTRNLEWGTAAEASR